MRALHSLVPIVRQPVFTSENFHTILALSLALFFTLEGFYSTTKKPTIKNLNIQIHGLPDEFDNFTIAMVSDIHAGPSVGKARVIEIVEIVNNLNPDAIAIVGDFVDGYIKNMANRIEPFKNLHAKYGVYGALGNHDYFFEPVDNWIKYFNEELKIKMLVNDAVVLKKGGKELCFAGTDDLLADFLDVYGHGVDVAQALSQCPVNISTIVMAHQPNGAAKVLREITKLHRKVDLILSGHTHAGQMFITVLFGYFFNQYFFGHYFYAPTDTQIYVSSGINYWGPPLKMFPSLCEIVNIRLLKG
uniref:Calcineurin-like phosphoesterase domain-containing protein n=1 Tax=Panagrolaimus sp. ES5 TaxID=591445 RepID=A0AC34FT02_9BILA